MSALSHAASSASRDFPPAGRTFDLADAPINLPELISEGHLFGLEQSAPPHCEADTETPLGDNDWMDDDYEASAPKPLAFVSYRLANLSPSSQDELTDANHLVYRGRRKRWRPRIKRLSASIPQRPLLGMVPDTMPELMLEMDELPLRLTRLVSPRTSPQAILPLPPGAPPPDTLKPFFSEDPIAFSRSDGGQVDDTMADDARPPTPPVLQPMDQSYGARRSSSHQIKLLKSYEELYYQRRKSMSRIGKNEERRDNNPQPMQMQLQFDYFHEAIPVRPICPINH